MQASISTPTNLARRRSITETKTFRLKEEKNHINYETQQSIMGRGETKPRLNTAEVAIQVSGRNFYTIYFAVSDQNLLGRSI